MPHYNAYESFKTKKSLEKKRRAKEKAFSKKNEFPDKFVVNSSHDYGIVLEVRYDDASVLYNDNVVVAKLRKDVNLICNQVIFPGDKVVIEQNGNNFVIQYLVKRTSLLSRVKKDRTRIDDVGAIKYFAANVDVAVIVVAAKEPPLHPKFIDRYLMILQDNGIPAVVCLNKSDLKTDEEEILDVYRDLNIPVVETSTYDNFGIKELERHLRGKQAIFIGNSGVGKSSLINAIMNNNQIKTSHVSEKSKRGRHTTTTSKYYIWNANSSIIDTPGIRSLDVSSFSPLEIQDYFPELAAWRSKCKYKDCLHYSEPYESCNVKQEVAHGLINADRYESYLRILNGILNFDKDYEAILKELLGDNQTRTNKLHR